MNKTGLIISGSMAIVTILFVVAYSLFNVLGVTQSRVKRNELTFVTESSEKSYDTLELSNDNWYIESGSLAEGDTMTVVMGTSITKPASVDNVIGVTILDFEGKNVTLNYNLIYKLGTLVVHPIELTIETDAKSKLFDGSELSSFEWYLTSGQLFENDRIEYVMTSHITNPGVIDNEIGITIFNEDNEIVTDIYDITYNIGLLSVYAIDITISTLSDEKGYDGLPLSGGSPTLRAGRLYQSNYLDYGPETSITNPGEVVNEVDVRILDSNGNDVTAAYNITYDFGTLIVNPIEIVLRSPSESKTYDGEPLSNGNWDLVSGTVPDTYTLDVDVNNEITDVGTIENTIFASVTDESGTDVTHLYNFEFITGTLTVVARNLTIETETLSKLFDGSVLSSNVYNILQGELSDTHRITYMMNSSITNPGVIDNTIEITILNEENQDVTNEYNIELLLGTLTVVARDITVFTDNFEKGYDGSPLLGGTGELIAGELGDGNDIVFGPENSITNPEAIDNELDVRILDEDGNDVTAGYNITYDFGTVEVLPIELVLKSDDASKVYDGLPLSDNNWELFFGEVLEGHTLMVDVDNQITNAGSIENTIVAYIINESGNDVSNVYNIEYNPGTLTVHAIDITISTLTDEKGYDGLPLLGGSAVVSGDLAASDHLEFGEEISIVNPMEVSNNIEVSIINEEGNNVTSSYNITYDYGTLTINAIQIVLESNDASKVYDGLPLFGDEWNQIFGEVLDTHTLIANVDNEITYAGTIDNTIVAYVVDELNNNVNYLYDIELLEGTLTVVPVSITFSTLTDEKGYDGLPLLGGSAVLEVGNVISTDHIEYGQESSVTNPDSITNTSYIMILNEEGQNVTTSYDITYNYGTLTVNPIQIIIKSDDASKVYDGTPLSANVETLLQSDLIDGHTLIVDIDNQITNPGSIDNTINAYVINESSNDVSHLYDFEFITGTLTVEGVPISISTATDAKPYDGLPLLGGGITIQSGALVGSDYIVLGTENSITNPGSIENELAVTILDDQGNDVTFVYEITSNYGTLTVNPITIILKSNDASKVYDGLPLSDNVWELLNGTLLSGHNLVVDIDNEITDVGEIENSLYGYVLDDQLNNVTSFYNIEYNAGTLSIFSSDYSSSEIAKSSFEGSIEDAFKVYSLKTENIYFKDKSYGDYTLSGWTSGVEQDTSITVNPLSFTGTALEESGMTSSLVQVEYVREQIPYLLPYYSMDPFSTLGDIHISGVTTGVLDLNIMSYNYDALNPITLLDENLLAQEAIYRTYVYNNYLGIPASTEAEMLTLAQENGLIAGSETIISDVQDYISNAATYNLDFAPIPDGVDVAVYFLTVSKEGICQHYATAGTLMYRALGIPARYATGYLGVVEANQWTTVTGEFAHAWVEVYIDGLGWVPVEVTGSGSGSGGDTGGDPVGPDPISIVVQPAPVSELYAPGTVITASEALIYNYNEFYSLGYTYQATYGGSLDVVGTEISTIDTFTIYDSEGNDATALFDITFIEGTLQLYESNIGLITSDDSKNYDGSPLTNSEYSINGTLEEGHYIYSVVFSGEQTNVGISQNRATITIYDQDGNDVTLYYNIVAFYGDLTVYPSEITVQSDSSSKAFDGTELINHDYEIILGTLASTDILDITITGSQTGIGNSTNTIESIQIFNNGVEVTSNYTITVIEGELTVTPPY